MRRAARSASAVALAASPVPSKVCCGGAAEGSRGGWGRGARGCGWGWGCERAAGAGAGGAAPPPSSSLALALEKAGAAKAPVGEEASAALPGS
jgi:hypothetical protein